MNNRDVDVKYVEDYRKMHQSGEPNLMQPRNKDIAIHIAGVSEENYQKIMGKKYPIFMREFLNNPNQKEHPIVEKFVPESGITTIFGEPGSLKSILADYIGCCVATGKKFLDKYKVRKLPVLILSTENSEKTDRKRLSRILKGMKVYPTRRSIKNLNLAIYGRKDISLFSDSKFYKQLKENINDYGIKLLIIDTLSPMILEKNDNSASEIVATFKEHLFPLIDEFKLSIIIIMHSQKTGKDFLGSIKHKANAEAFYELERKDDYLSLLCHKHRDGERNLKIKAEFIEKNEQLEKITFSFLEEWKGKQSARNKENNPGKEKQVCEFILGILQQKEWKFSEIILNCKKEGYKESTSKRAMTKLYESNKIGKQPGKSGGYYII